MLDRVAERAGANALCQAGLDAQPLQTVGEPGGIVVLEEQDLLVFAEQACRLWMVRDSRSHYRLADRHALDDAAGVRFDERREVHGREVADRLSR